MTAVPAPERAGNKGMCHTGTGSDYMILFCHRGRTYGDGNQVAEDIVPPLPT